jgi:hypothetical protein
MGRTDIVEWETGRNRVVRPSISFPYLRNLFLSLYPSSSIPLPLPPSYLSSLFPRSRPNRFPRPLLALLSQLLTLLVLLL